MAHAADFPLQLDARIGPHPVAHRLAQRLDVVRRGVLDIEQEIGVQLAHLRAAHPQAPAAGGVDQLPARMALRVLEGGAARLGLGGLAALPLLGDFPHAVEDIFRLARKTLIDRRDEHRAARPVGLAIAIAHVGIGQRDDLALPRHRAQFDHAVARLGAVAAGVHVERAPDAAGNAAIEGEPVYPRLGRRRRHLDVGQRHADADAVIVQHLHLSEGLAREADDHPVDAAVAHQQVRAQPDHRGANLGRQVFEEERQVFLVGRGEEQLRRPADAEPGDFAQGLVGDQPAAHLGNPGLQLRDQVGIAHFTSFCSSAPSSPGSAAAHCVILPAPRHTT